MVWQARPGWSREIPPTLRLVQFGEEVVVVLGSDYSSWADGICPKYLRSDCQAELDYLGVVGSHLELGQGQGWSGSPSESAGNFPEPKTGLLHDFVLVS